MARRCSGVIYGLGSLGVWWGWDSVSTRLMIPIVVDFAFGIV
jgi:hypothetical protein